MSLLSREGSRARSINMCTRDQRRTIHTKPSQATPSPASASAITKADLHDLVDIYDTRHQYPPPDFQPWEDDAPLSDGTGLGIIGPEVLDTKPWDEDYFTNNAYLSYASEPWSNTAHILEALSTLLQDPLTPHADLYLLYKRLPGNRVNYIPRETLGPLLSHLMRIPSSRFQKGYASDFLGVLYDMRAEGVPISIAMWTSAIRFIGLAEGARNAVRLWREMESHYGLKATNHTFSVLFDLACKSQNFALAEMVEKEARERRIPLDRVSRMSRIFYHGLLGDGAGVRRSYAALVEAGEIVDTAVLTCVITALLDAGEPAAAEETFSRMKTLHAEKKGATSAPHTWQQRRELRTLLTDAAHRYRDRPTDRQKFQDAAPINPDWRTYRAFISYHARTTASFPAIESLLLEMKKASPSIPLNREIYRIIFHGFAKHGGIQVVDWNARNLEVVWRSFERSCERRGEEEFGYDSVLAVAVVKAFLFVVGKGRAREVWERLRERWVVERGLEEFVESLLERKGRRRSWKGG